MKTIKGPGIFLLQFVREEAPYNTIDGLSKWVADMGYKGVQLPTWLPSFFDVELAAESDTYCDEVLGTIAQHGLTVTELCSHLQGQLVASHPAYDQAVSHFLPEGRRGDARSRADYGAHIMKKCADASMRMKLTKHVTLPGNLLWPYMYPGAWRPTGIIEDGYQELARRWQPLLDHFDGAGVDVCYEVHAVSDVHDGISFEKFRSAVADHPRCNILYDPSHLLLQQLDYLDFIDIYAPFIKVMHVKDAEFNPSGRQGVYGGYEPWGKRAGRFRSLGDGQIDFRGIFSRLTLNGFDGWATLEWECCVKDSEQGAREGAPFIRDRIIEAARTPYESEIGTHPDRSQNAKDLGIA